MALIKTKQISRGKSYLEMKINCDSKGEFSARLPEFVAEKTGVRIVTAKTMDEVETGWLKQIEAFEEAKVEVRQILCYEIDTGLDSYGSESLKIGVEISAYKETVTTTSLATTYVYDELKHDDVGLDEDLPAHRLSRGWRENSKPYEDQIPLTPEAVKFFNDFYSSFRKLQMGLREITKSPKKLVNAINSGTPLLSAPKE